MMENYDDLFFVTVKRPKTDEEIIAEIITHTQNAREAMNQAARTGNANTAQYLIEGLEARAAHSGNNSSLETLEAKMKEAFGPGKEKTDG